MRKCWILVSVILLSSITLWSQAKPTAVIDTTAGKLTCTLFPDKAPIGVANFIACPTEPRIGPVPSLTRKNMEFRFTTAQSFTA